jgi:hypothetical protein
VEQPGDALSYVLVADELPMVKLIEAFLHLRAEPAVMVDVLLDELLDVLSRVGMVLGGDLRELGLGFGREVDFHPLKDNGR